VTALGQMQGWTALQLRGKKENAQKKLNGHRPANPCIT
jgi:hypothetical protein